MAHRRERLGDMIRAELARLLREEVRDPRIGFVTLTDVELSKDLRHARVYVTILGDDPSSALGALRHAAPFLRRALAQCAELRFTPELRFLIDESIDAGFRVDELLSEIGPIPPAEEDDLPVDGESQD